MELKPVDGSGRAGGRLVRFAGGRGTPVYNLNGRKLGRIEWLALDPQSGRIAQVTISSRRFGLFAGKQATLPWSAISFEEATGRLIVQTGRARDEAHTGCFAPAVRCDPARGE